MIENRSVKRIFSPVIFSCHSERSEESRVFIDVVFFGCCFFRLDPSVALLPQDDGGKKAMYSPRVTNKYRRKWAHSSGITKERGSMSSQDNAAKMRR